MFKTHKTTLCLTLAAFMAASPSVALAQQIPPAGVPYGVPSATQPALGTASQPVSRPVKRIDASYVTPETVFAAVAYPRRVLTAPEAEMLPIEVLTAVGKTKLGVDPMDVEEVMLLIEPPASLRPGPGSPEPNVGLIVRFSRPYDLGSFMPGRLDQATTPATIDGKTYRRPNRPGDPNLFMPDDRTLIVATETMLQKMVAQKKSDAAGPMRQVLAGLGDTEDAMAILMLEPMRPLIQEAMRKAPPLPGPFAGFLDIPNLISVIGFKARLTGPNPRVLLSVRANDDSSAQRLEAMFNGGLVLAKQIMLAQMAQEMAKKPAGDDPVEQAGVRYAQRMSNKIADALFEALRPVRTGDRLELSTEGKGAAQPQMTHVAVMGVLVALLLPAVQAAREAARRVSSTNNMKQLAIAMLNHESAKRRFPARANFDANGKPLLSWRVHILPYIEEQALYERFHLDEPWDSPNNKQLIPLMPPVFRNPSSAAGPGMTTYFVPVGPGLMFDGRKSVGVRDITDGTSNTILLLEANDERAVEWTKPDDWNFDPKTPLAGLGKAHPGGFNATFSDGSIHFISAAIDQTVFRALLTIAGREAVDPNAGQ